MTGPAAPPGAPAILARFPRERQWLLPALRALQEAFGWLPEAALAAAAAHLRVPASEVYGVATHYPELRLRPRGRRHVRVCTGVACALLGGRALLDALAARLGTTPGAWAEDAPVSLEAADCVFACAVGPLVEVDGALRGRVTPADAEALAAELAAPDGGRAAPPPAEADLEDLAEASPGAPSPAAALAALVEAARERARRRPALRLLVGAGTCGRAVGARAVHAALAAEAARRGLAVEVVDGACSGACWAAPAVEVQRPGWPRVLLERVAPTDAARLLAALEAGDVAGFRGVVWAERAWGDLMPAATHPFWRGQTRVLLARAGTLDPASLDDALLGGSYRALAAALAAPPEAVVEAVRAAGLLGRGGACFPAALKWAACRAGAAPRYLVMNGEEGEPGIFKDRHLLEADPHLVLEGVLLAAYAAGAERAILYVHGEADLAAARLARAVHDARAAGLVGPRVLGSGFGCVVELRRGAGGFVLGEETALLESVEGRRAQPRPRPPFPAEAGLWGRPTVVNNVETLAAVPGIVAAEAPRETKLFGLSGPLRRPGLVEVGPGATLAGLLEALGGGTPDGRALVAAVVGGPSGTLVPAARFAVPMAPRGEVSPGTGGVVAVPAGAALREVVRTLLAFNAAESCGKCTPCREGLPRLLALLDELGAPEAEAAARRLGETIHLASLCGLGQAAPLAVLRALDDFGPALRGAPA